MVHGVSAPNSCGDGHSHPEIRKMHHLRHRAARWRIRYRTKRWSPPQRVLRQAPGWFTECPPLSSVGAAAHHPKSRKIHLLRHFTIRRRIRSQQVGLRWRPMGAPFHDAAQSPGGRFIGVRAGPRGPGSGSLSLEGGAPEKWGRRKRTLSPRHGPSRRIRRESNRAPPHPKTRPTRPTWTCEGGRSPRQVTGPLVGSRITSYGLPLMHRVRHRDLHPLELLEIAVAGGGHGAAQGAEEVH